MNYLRLNKRNLETENGIIFKADRYNTSMNKITFYASTFYKFQNLNYGLPLKLLEVFVKNSDELSESFDDYENTYWDWDANRNEKLAFPEGEKIIVLLFKDETDHVFTVVRKYSEGSFKNYLSKRGEAFIIEFINKYKYDV